MNKELINYYITLPMAITIFRQDRKTFGVLKFGNLFEDKLDATIEQMKKDFYALKKDLITNNMEIKLIDQCKYNVAGTIVEYTPDELKDLTTSIMHQYLYGSKAVDFELENRVWRDVDTRHKR
ncbi:DUF3158 domain-containing protein [Virgibacillus phage Mimir87]|nr:DUF3158 domain-containing protein [Virgibacillus phage Mimir87]